MGRKAVLGLSLLLAGCAGYARVSEYPMHLPRNVTVVHIASGKAFTVKQHPRDNTIMIQTTMARAAGAGLVSGLSMGVVSMNTIAAIEPQYREAADKWAASRGCTVERIYQLESVSYEALLACPGGKIPRTPAEIVRE